MVGVLSCGGIRFDIDREECFSYNVHYEGVTLHLSFVFIKADTPWHFKEDGVDLVIKGLSGEQIHDFRDKVSEKYEFVVKEKGVYQFCFTNKSPYHETIDFDIYVGHFIQYDQHAKDEHFSPLLEQISKLEEALHNIQFEQHWLEAQTDRQAIGHDVDTRAAIFSDTRAEWLIAFQDVTVVTVYASLGEDALVHSLNVTQVTTVICDSKLLKKLSAITLSLKTIKNVIYFEDDGSENDLSRSLGNWTVSSFSDVEELGRSNPVDPSLPSKNGTAVIMYTSGRPTKATAAAVKTVIPKLGRDDVYLAYLPLAHVFELAAESVMLAAGCAIGYGSTLTITGTSSKIKKGTKGDASVLKPNLMAAVPAILDRVREGVVKKVEEKGGIAKNLFKIGYKRRLAAVEGRWFGAWGLELEVTYSKFKFDLLYVSSIRAPIGQGYGLTETFAGAAFSEWDDTTVGRVGPPLPCSYIKLVSWEEGGYKSSDKPMPRGEVVVGGFSVTAGYFNNPEKTDEVYKVDERGMRWFYTGDIGQFHPDGCLEIIDRKKDIVKLQHGEYTSLGKVEAALSSANYVDSIMVHADPSTIVLLLSFHHTRFWRTGLKQLASSIKIFQSLFSEKTVSEVGKAAKLDKFEIPAKIKLLPEPWTPESGLVTAALKIKREQLKAKFKDDLQKMYG
ncbi:hypothetical protein LWI29_012780 [Acer saccharum]|uniref:GOLD domain-containing protein n=1 Tax=Acer saccharum TaxID=4024 RepID=A0AA39VSV1_ACESA|nr:hypothetical protein LWI29_012780 [Acer saccharum]